MVERGGVQAGASATSGPPIAHEGPVVYCLVARNGSTYIGATVDLAHRIRQHNGELVGGARATSRHPNGWRPHCYVENFPSWRAALQFEWRWKHLGRKLKLGRGITPLIRRESALGTLLELDRATSAAVPYADWPAPPRVVWLVADADSPALH